MENTHKIITDIIAEMRGFKRYAASDSSDCRYVAYWLYQTFADRLEAALRATTEKSPTVGNMAAMREACQKMHDLLMLRGDGKTRCVLTWDEFNESQKMLRAAISAPRRNCEVGTAEEQLKRFKDFCRMISKDETCDGCPLLPQCSTLEHCTLAWAQMPYEDGCAK